MVNHFLSKRSKFYIVRTIQFCSNFTNMWSKYLSNNVWRDFRLSMSVSAMVTYNTRSENQFLRKFAVFPATISNADIRSLKSLHTFLKECLYHMLVEFEQNRMVQTTRNFKLFNKKPRFQKLFLTKHWRHFGRCFCT